MNNSVCRVCEGNSVETLIDFGDQPIVNNFLSSHNEEYKTYPFRLGFCLKCGFLQLIDTINPEILYKNYFTVSSWKNQPHVQRLIEVIEDITGLNHNDRILEIGCNDGSFLEQLRTKGYSNIFGVEPTQDSFELATSKKLEVNHCFFTNKTSRNYYEKNDFNLVVTRQVLEHISDLDDFLEGINFVLNDEGTLVIEIPDSQANINSLDYGLWEEHVNYFTLNTLKTLLHKHFFNVIHYEVTLFAGNALTVFCKKMNHKKTKEIINDDMMAINKFRDDWPFFKENLLNFLDSRDMPIAMYGCGARSSNFLNFTGAAKQVEFYIDDQIEKQNLYVPGQSLKIKPWEEKFRDEFYMLLGVNTENEYKVIKNRGLIPNKYSSVLPPSQNLPEFWKKMI